MCNNTLLSCRYMDALKDKDMVIVSMNGSMLQFNCSSGKKNVIILTYFSIVTLNSKCSIRTRQPTKKWDAVEHGVHWFFRLISLKRCLIGLNSAQMLTISRSMHPKLRSKWICRVRVKIPKLNDQFSITPISFRLQINKLVNYCSVISSSVSWRLSVKHWRVVI